MGIFRGMQTRAWKLVAHIPGLDGKPGWREYYVVRDTGQMQAVATLIKRRPELADCRIEPRGEASEGFMDWVEPDNDVFQVVVMS